MGLSIFLLLFLETVRKLITFWPESVNRPLHTFIYFLYFSMLYAPSSIYLLYANYHLNGQYTQNQEHAENHYPVQHRYHPCVGICTVDRVSVPDR